MSTLWNSLLNGNVYGAPCDKRIETVNSNARTYHFAVRIGRIKIKVERGQEYQARLCIYDEQYCQFFGRSWKGRWIVPDDSGGFETNSTVFFHTAYRSSSVQLVLEIGQRPSGQPDGDALAGWAIVRLANDSRLTDYAGHEKPVPNMETGNLLAGSPSSLLVLKSSAALSMFKTVGRVQYLLQNHPRLMRAEYCVPENTLIGVNEIVPGLEPQSGGVPLANPVPAAPAAAVISDLVIQLGPFTTQLEDEVCKLINRERLQKDNQRYSEDPTEKFVVDERRLRIGVHNGWTYVHDPFVFSLSDEDGSGGGGSASLRRKAAKLQARSFSADPKRHTDSSQLYLRQRVDLKDLVEDSGMAVVFVLDYIVRLQTSKPNPPSESVAVCWGAFSPFSAQQLEFPAKITTCLLGGPTTNPDQVLCFKNLYRVEEMPGGRKKPITLPHISAQYLFSLKSDHVDTGIGSRSSEYEQPMGYPPRRTQPIPPPRQKPSQPTMGIGDSRKRNPIHPLMISGEHPSAAEDIDGAENERREGLRPTPIATSETITPSTIHQYRPLATISDQGMTYPQPPVVPQIVQWVNPPQPPPPIPHPAMINQLFVQDSEGQDVSGMDSIMIGNRTVGTCMIPRSIYAYLSQANFADVQDRHGDPPDMVDLNPNPAATHDGSRKVNIQRELKDPCSSNEIIVQFLALAPVPTKELSEATLPVNVFFSFQFYRFPLVSTERLLLSTDERLSGTSTPRILKRIDQLGNIIQDQCGYQVKFTVDPAYLKPGEQEAFLQYLSEHAVHIDVWDGDSLMLLGSSSVPLQSLCRGGREGVESWCQLSIISTDMNMSNPVTSTRALLYAKVANIGYPSTRDHGLIDVASKSRNAAVISQQLRRHTGEAYTVYAKSLPNQTISHVSFAQRIETADDERNEERRRQIRRLENIRQIERFASLRLDQNQRDSLSRQLESLKLLRQQNKEEFLRNVALKNVTTEHAIYPSLGSTEFMEFLIKNPFREPLTLDVQISDQQLQVVTDAREWEFHKRVHKLTTPLEVSMFFVDTSRNRDSVSLFLKPQEAVYVPLKYNSCNSLDQPYSLEPNRREPTQNKSIMVQNKTAKALFYRSENKELVCGLLLDVETQPVVLHRIFRFYHSENTFFTKFIRVGPNDVPVCSLTVMTAFRGGEADRLIRVSSSSRPEVRFMPAEPFILPAGALMEIDAAINPLSSGSQTYQITAVDVELQELIRSWLVYASVAPASVSKHYQLNIQINDDSVSKKIGFANPYAVQRTFYLTTNHPELLTFTTDSLPNVPPKTEAAIGLQFRAVSRPTVKELLVFINDPDGNTEKTLAIKVNYVTTKK